MTQKYTVVLLRPDDMENEDFRRTADRLYVAVGIEAADCHEAERLGKREVWDADRREAKEKDHWFNFNPEDYIMLCIFVGEHNPKWFGWSAGFNKQ